MVIRYSILWSREARSGASEGRKDRPCAIVVAAPLDRNGDGRVVVVPITYAAPANTAACIPLLPAVKGSLGLDAEPSWICLDELNVFAWPGYDFRSIPETGRYEYGVLPEDLFYRVRDGILALQRAGRTRQVLRD